MCRKTCCDGYRDRLSLSLVLLLTGMVFVESAEAEQEESPGEVLAAALEANRYWFEGPAKETPPYSYTFVHRDGERQEFRVDDPKNTSATLRQGITYTPLSGVLLKALAEGEPVSASGSSIVGMLEKSLAATGPKVATLESLERTDDEILITFQTDGSLWSRLGGGVSGTWSGYIGYTLGSGTLRLDAKTLMPIELVSTHRDEGREETTVTERLSEPYEIVSGHWVPLRVEAIRHEKSLREGRLDQESTYRFDWMFRAYEPGVWLFDAQLAGEGTAIGYHLEDVRIGDEQPVTLATSSLLESMRASNARARTVVDQYAEANRAWLLPDISRRKGLAYDYSQEDGYREQVAFDAQGNVLVQLMSNRQSLPDSSGGGQQLFTADGREASGTADEPFLIGRPADPTSSSPFSGNKMLNNLALGWGWDCASMRLARSPDDFGMQLRLSEDGATQTLVLRPVRNSPSLHIGTMLRYISWAYLPRKSFARCEIELDADTLVPLRETYFGEGEEEAFCTIRFENWLDTPEGKAPGSVIGRCTYRKRGERDPETREYAYFEEVFTFTGKHRLTEDGLLLLDEVVTTFQSTEQGSTGRVTRLDEGGEAQARVEDAVARLDATSDFLRKVAEGTRGKIATVPCRWGEAVPVWLNGKRQHAMTGVGEDKDEPPFVAYQSNLGVQDVRPEVLDDGTVRVTVNVYSTIYSSGYEFDVAVGLMDADSVVLAEKSASDTTKTLSRPELKQIVLEFAKGVNPDAVTSIAVSLNIKRKWGAPYYRGMWTNVGSSGTDNRKIDYLPGGRDWGPEQAIGEPDSHSVGGDFRNAWSPLTEDGQQEWLELTYAKRITAIGVNVHETFNPGAVCMVTYYDAQGDEQMAWQGIDPMPSDIRTGVGVSKIRFPEPVETDRVRIYLASEQVAGWNEIDAVALVEETVPEAPEPEHWARDAQASSTYAEGPQPEVTYQYDGPHKELKYDDGFRDRKQSLGGGRWQVIRFTRPEDHPYLDAVRILASSYGRGSRSETLYLLDEQMNVLEELKSSDSRVGSGSMIWHLFHAPSVEVPRVFHVAFDFGSQEYYGSYIATRRLAEGESGHSYLYAPGGELSPLEREGEGHDWMIRAYMAAEPNMEARAADEARKQSEAATALITQKGRNWGPEQATGAPDAFGNSTGGDYHSAWASKSQDSQAEWLDLTYEQKIKAIGVDIYETYNPGAVNKITVFDSEANETVVWEGIDPTPVGIAGGKGISKIRFAKPIETGRVRIYLDSVAVKGWNEIDAVGLIEPNNNVHWAKSATASSTYAE